MERQITIEDIVRAGVEGLRASIYISMPGVVVSYDSNAQRADVQPLVNDTRTNVDTGAPVSEPWPMIPSVPVGWLRFGGMVIAGVLKQGDMVTLEAWDLDPSAAFQTGRSLQPVDPLDVRRLGGNYWRAIPHDMRGAIADAAAAGGGLLIGLDGGQPQIRITPTAIQLGATGGDALALASKVDANFAALTAALNTVVTALVGFATHMHGPGSFAVSTAPGAVTGTSGGPTSTPSFSSASAPAATSSLVVKAQ